MKIAQELRKHIPRGPEEGSLVRTRRIWPGGVHRAQVSRVFDQDGIKHALVAGHHYPLAELEVIRDPVCIR